MDELEMKRQILERLEAVDIPLPRKFNKTEFNVYSFSNDIAPLAYTAAINILHYCNSVKHAQKYDAKGALKTVLSIWSDAAAEKNRRYHDGYISELQ
ncbi:MAG: hypothetical protein LBS99_00255, partial [Clostridiales bacterium]|nr:hypothetical protein [Clostridiales bacterium]